MKYKKQIDDVSPIIRKQTGTTYYNTSKYDLSRLKGDSTNVLINFRNYVNGYSPEVKEIIENFQFSPVNTNNNSSNQANKTKDE